VTAKSEVAAVVEEVPLAPVACLLVGEGFVVGENNFGAVVDVAADWKMGAFVLKRSCSLGTSGCK